MFDVDWCTHSFHSIPFHSFSIQLSSVQFNSTQLNSISHSFITFSHSFQDISFEFKCVHSLHSFDPNHFVSFLQSTPCIHSVQFSFIQFKHSFVFFQFLRVQHITLGHSSWTWQRQTFFSYRRLFPYIHFLFWNFRPRLVRALLVLVVFNIDNIDKQICTYIYVYIYISK
jgi:hypothetical protein